MLDGSKTVDNRLINVREGSDSLLQQNHNRNAESLELILTGGNCIDFSTAEHNASKLIRGANGEHSSSTGRVAKYGSGPKNDAHLLSEANRQ